MIDTVCEFDLNKDCFEYLNLIETFIELSQTFVKLLFLFASLYYSIIHIRKYVMKYYL